VPSIGGKELDLCKLYKAVYQRGGSVQVSTRKLWKEIVNEFSIPSSCTSASFTLRNHYNKCLLAYENKFLQENHPEAIHMGDRAMMGGPGPGRPVGSGSGGYGANQTYSSSYRDLGPQNIFSTTQVVHNTSNLGGGQHIFGTQYYG